MNPLMFENCTLKLNGCPNGTEPGALTVAVALAVPKNATELAFTASPANRLSMPLFSPLFSLMFLSSAEADSPVAMYAPINNGKSTARICVRVIWRLVSNPLLILNMMFSFKSFYRSKESNDSIRLSQAEDDNVHFKFSH
ncbi:MAG: hypothetical protein IPO77_21810 [Acidobacteria bacterium]|nr:hypothetical protein [Acidobacteriota bacterium]